MAIWKTWLASLHRYLGIALCLLFAMWFASGIVMLFHPYPALSAADRFACLSPIDVAATRGIGALLARVPAEASRIWLTAADGRALLHVSRGDAIHSWSMDAADAAPIGTTTARVVAGRCGWGHPVSLDTIRDDQWSVHQRFDPDRPLYRVTLDDAAATVVYVSSRTGEVVQKTDRSSRAWNWLGSVPHWIYPTVIRRHWALWDSLVWWLSGAGTVGVLAGLAIGVVRWRRSPWSRISPFRGALYWHHVTGIAGGVVVLAWILSGMLSMDHGRLFSTDAPTPAQVATLKGASTVTGNLAAALRRLEDLPHPPREIEWVSIAGEAFIVARSTSGQQSILRADGSPEGSTFMPATLHDAATRLVPNARLIGSDVLDAYDNNYYGREHAPRPLPVLRLRYDDSASTWFHVDLASGAILERANASRRAYRYWFNALHAHDLQWMLDRPRLRRAWMVTLCTGGLVFSLNAVWLAWKRLRPMARQ